MPILEALFHKVGTICRLIREDRGRLLRIIRGDFFITIVHSAELDAIPPPSERTDLEFRKISDEALIEIVAAYPELAYQEEVMQILEANSAYAVYIGGQFANMCWLMTEDLDRRQKTRFVRLRPHEVEIAKGFTFPEYRGQGLHPFAIRSVCAVARGQHAKRVFAITKWSNATSRRGIEKAGLRRLGLIVEIRPPLIGTVFRPILRLFRMSCIRRRWPVCFLFLR